jgi:DNA-binding MarR family transcriptional regulator
VAVESEPLGHLLYLATRCLRATLTDKLAPYGLTSAQCAVLATVAAMEKAGRGDDISAASVGARLQQVDRTTMSGIVRRLARDGWVTLRIHPTDRRARVISLTAKAKGLLPTFAALRAETIAEAARGLDEAELSALRASLRKIIENLT